MAGRVIGWVVIGLKSKEAFLASQVWYHIRPAPTCDSHHTRSGLPCVKPTLLIRLKTFKYFIAQPRNYILTILICKHRECALAEDSGPLGIAIRPSRRPHL